MASAQSVSSRATKDRCIGHKRRRIQYRFLLLVTFDTLILLQKTIIFARTLAYSAKKQYFCNAKQKTSETMERNMTCTPRQLSKIGLWMRDNKGGIIVVNDRKAVEK